MRRSAPSLFAIAGLPLIAGAVVNTSMVWQVSLTGGIDDAEWSSDVNVAAAGSTLVYARARVSYIGTASPVGLASFVFQPTVSNWDVSDGLSPFVNGGTGKNTSTPVGVVTDEADLTQFGRISPWGRSNVGTAQHLTGFVQTGPGPASNPVPAGSWLRIAQAQVVNWIGGTGNTTGGSGVPIAQLSNNFRTSSDPAFNPAITGVNVFKMGLTINGAVTGRTVLDVDAPAGGFGNLNTDAASPNFGDREVYWFNDLTESTGSIRGTAAVIPAHIHIITPSPAPLALLGMGGLAVRRRRR